MTRALRTTAAVAAAVVVSVGALLPPARLFPATGTGDDSVAGVFHVHTNRSDGLSSPEAIAAIAAKVGLKFVVFTDHGDATREPDPPSYRFGVLCIDAVEISTVDGHLVALGLPEAPYPLAGEARDVLEDVHRLGGIGIAAHPNSPRSDLQWRDWDAAIDGVELLNLDTEWRARAAAPGWRAALQLARSLSTYLIRPSETIASLVGDSRGLDARWLALAKRRRLPIFAGADAHARLELSGGDPSERGWALALPGYESVFKTLTMRVRPVSPLTGDAPSDSRMILDALRQGHSYTSLDGIMTPPAFAFSATSGASTVQQGDDLVADGPITLTLVTNAPPSFTTVIWRNSEVFYSEAASPDVTVNAPAGGAVYRAEIRAANLPNAPAWILSNGLTVRPASSAAATLVAPPRTTAARSPGPAPFDRTGSIRWTTESSATAKIAFDGDDSQTPRELRVRFGLPGGDAFDHYVALVGALDGGIADRQTVSFTARSDKPMRVSVQLRVPGGPAGDRWRRSVYVDTGERAYDLAFDDFRPVGDGLPRHPRLADVHALLFVIDQTNTRPATSGRVTLSKIGIR